MPRPSAGRFGQGTARQRASGRRRGYEHDAQGEELQEVSASPELLNATIAGAVPMSMAAAGAMQRSAGNQAVARLVQREGPDVPTAVRRTTRSSVETACSEIDRLLSIGIVTEPMAEVVLHLLLLNADRATELRETYLRNHHRTLNSDLVFMGPENELRAHEYLLVGRLRPIAKVMIAMSGLGTAEGTLWRVLTEAAPTAVGDWDRLKADHAGLAIVNSFSENLYDALDGDFDGADLDKAWALARFGQLRPEDKIRIATNQAGTDLPLLWEGLRSANPATIAASYEREYHESLEELLFDQGSGEDATMGELSAHDVEYARSLLGAARTDPDRLVTIATQMISGTNDFSLLLSAVQRDSPTPVQLERLKIAVKDDTIGLNSWGGLGAGELAQLKAVLGIQEQSTDVAGGSEYFDEGTLRDGQVMALRAKGGVDRGSVFDTLLKYTRTEIDGAKSAFNSAHSHFNRYIAVNTSFAEQYTELPTVFNGSVWAKLRLCCGGMRDDYEDYAVHVVSAFATSDEKSQLAQAFRQIGEGTVPTGPAARAAQDLWSALSTSEVNRVRDACDSRAMDILGTAAAMEERTARERSDLFDDSSGPSSEAAGLDDERRELRTGIHSALLDGSISAAEGSRLGGAAERTSSAISEYAAARDEFAGYASMTVNLAVGLIVAVGTGGAAAPAVVAAVMRSAAAMAITRVVAERAIRGSRFDVLGADGARAFLAGATDGVMNVVGAGAAAGVLERIGVEGARTAIETNSASLGLRLVNEALNGSMSGSAGGIVDSITNEATWANGVSAGIRTTLVNSATSAAQGAVTSAAITAGSAGLGAAGERLGFGGEGGEGRGVAGAHGGTAGGATTTRSGSAPAAGSAADGPRLSPDDPVLLRVGFDHAAEAEIVRRLGVWEHGIAALESQTGIAADLSRPHALAIREALVSHRANLVADLGERFGARPAGNASTTAGSDMDLSVGGTNAGERLMNTRAFLDAHYPGWQRNYRMALMVAPERIGSINNVLGALPAAERMRIRTELSRDVEAFVVARRLRSVHDPVERAALLNGLEGPNRDLAEGFSLLDESGLRARHDDALDAGDVAMRNYEAATTPAERLRWAREATRQQMIANAMGADAYVSPASVEAFVTSGGPAGIRAALGRLDPHGQYDVLVDQVDMMAHQIHEAGGVIPALRRYELYKYVERFCTTIEATGINDPQLTYFRNLADLHYRVDRTASAATRGPITNAGGPDLVGAHVAAGNVYMAGRSADGPSDQFLLSFWNDFQPWANRQSVAMRARANGETVAGGAGGSGSSGAETSGATSTRSGGVGPTASGPDAEVARPVSPVPAASAEDIALASAPVRPVEGPVLDGDVSAQHRSIGGGIELPGHTANQLVGRVMDSEATARMVLDRLRRGDASPLTALGVTVPEGFNPSLREWGIGQNAAGQFVLVYGNTAEVNWSRVGDGIVPIGHSHPVTAGNAVTPGQSVGDIISGRGRAMQDVLPSGADVVFTQARRLDHHDVYTPYTIDQVGRVYNAGARGPDGNELPGLTFRIADVQVAGRIGDATNGRNVLSALLIATDVHGNVHHHSRIFVDHYEEGVLIGGSVPESLEMRPVGTAGISGTGGAAGAGANSSGDGDRRR